MVRGAVLIVLDTSVWLANLIPVDGNHADTVPFFELMESRPIRFAVPAHFIAEVAGVLARIGQSAEVVEGAINAIDRGGRFEIHPTTIGSGLRAAEVAHLAKLRGSDAVFVALGQELDLPLITWDKQQRQRGALFCRTMTPLEAVRALR